MRDPSLIIRQKYIDLLSGQVLLGVTSVPVVDKPSKGQRFPYIIISQQTSNGSGNSCKDIFRHDTTIIFDIVTGFKGEYGGKKHCDIIGDNLLKRINWFSENALDLSPDFRMISAELDNILTLPAEVDGDEYIQRKTITIRHEVEELVSN